MEFTKEGSKTAIQAFDCIFNKVSETGVDLTATGFLENFNVVLAFLCKAQQAAPIEKRTVDVNYHSFCGRLGGDVYIFFAEKEPFFGDVIPVWRAGAKLGSEAFLRVRVKEWVVTKRGGEDVGCWKLESEPGPDCTKGVSLAESIDRIRKKTNLQESFGDALIILLKTYLDFLAPEAYEKRVQELLTQMQNAVKEKPYDSTKH